MDPVSISASIIAFIDAANKVKGVLSQVSANRERLQELSDNVITGIVDLESLLLTDCDAIAPGKATNLRIIVDSLRSELERVHGRCRRHLDQRREGRLSRAKSTLSAVFRRDEILAMIVRLEKQVQSYYLRCLVLITGDMHSSMTRTHSAVLRTEERVVLQRAEHRAELERLEGAFSRMIKANDREGLPPGLVINGSISKTDFDYLRRQVHRIINAYDRCKPKESTVCETPTGHHLSRHPWPWPYRDFGVDVMFNDGLKEACYALDSLTYPSDQLSVQVCAKTLLFLGYHLNMLRMNDDAALVLEMAIALYSMLSAGHSSIQYKRCLAFGLRLLSEVYQSSPDKLSIGQQAVKVANEIYWRGRDIMDLDVLINSMQSHGLHLRQNGMLKESLACTRRTLLWAHHYAAEARFVKWEDPTSLVSWTASGRFDIVRSSATEYSQYTCVAIVLARSLWDLTNALADLGLYAEAQIAGSDALSCLQAILAADPWWQQLGYESGPWRQSLAKWSAQRPDQSASTTRIEEIDELEDGILTDPSRPMFILHWSA